VREIFRCGRRLNRLREGAPPQNRGYGHAVFKIDAATYGAFRRCTEAFGLAIEVEYPRVPGEERSIDFDDDRFEPHTDTWRERLNRYAEQEAPAAAVQRGFV